MPGEVGLVLRGGRTTVDPIDVAPEIATSERSSALVDRAAAGAAFEAVRRVELLLDHWGTRPPVALRSGGLGVRDLKAAAGHLHVDEPTAALLVEVAAAAGLLALGTDEDGDQAWLPTDAFDRWSAPARRGPVGHPRRRLARHQPPPRPGRHPGPGRQDPQRPGPGDVERLLRRDPADGPRGAGGGARRARCWPPAPASRRWRNGWPGCGPGDPGRAPTRWAGRWRRPPTSA